MNEEAKLSDALKVGSTVRNPVAVMQWANVVTLMVGFIGAILVVLNIFGIKFTLSDAQISTLATALVTIVSFGRVLISKLVNTSPVLPPSITQSPKDP